MCTTPVIGIWYRCFTCRIESGAFRLMLVLLSILQSRRDRDKVSSLNGCTAGSDTHNVIEDFDIHRSGGKHRFEFANRRIVPVTLASGVPKQAHIVDQDHMLRYRMI